MSQHNTTQYNTPGAALGAAAAVGTASSEKPAQRGAGPGALLAPGGLVSSSNQRQDAGATAAVRFVAAVNLGLGVLRSISSTTNAQFVSSYQLDFNGAPGVYVSEGFAEENNILFAIARRDIDGKSEYFSLNLGSDVNVSLLRTAVTKERDTTLALKYSPKEAAAFKFGGPIVNPSLDDEIIVPPHRYHCNTIEKQKMSYDSLSSIGAATQEDISVSATNTTTFETTDGAIADVNGVITTATRYESSPRHSPTETTTTAATHTEITSRISSTSTTTTTQGALRPLSGGGY